MKAASILILGSSVWLGLAVATHAQEIMPTPTPTPIPQIVTPPASRVTASTNDGNVPGNTVDGSLATRWSGYGDGTWIEYDLGATMRLFEARVAVYKGDMRRNLFELRLSTDRVSWRTVFNGQSSGLTTAIERYSFPMQDARYVRYVGHGHVTNTGVAGAFNSVTEVQIISNQSSAILAPSSLVASPIYDAGAIMLRWAAGGQTRHNVFRSTTSTGPYTWVANVEGTQYTDWGLQNSVRYCYVVSSGTGAFFTHSRYSNESCALASVLVPPPDPPTNLIVQNGAVGCDGFVTTPLRLTWTAGARATSYNVYRGSAPGGPYTRVGTVSTTAFEYRTVGPGYWVVRSANATFESGPSNEVFGTFMIPGCPMPLEITPPPSGATASTHDGNVAGNAVDNNLTTRWSGFGDGAWLELDLGTVKRVSHFRLAVYRGNERRNQFEIQVRSDLTATWTTVFSGQSSGQSTGFESFDLPDPLARHFRYVGHGNVANATGTLGGWNSVNEIELFGY